MRLDERRARILQRALSMVGETPFQGENWCGRFALSVFHYGGLALEIKDAPMVGMTLCGILEKTSQPLPGDIVRMGKNPHYAFLLGIFPDEPGPVNLLSMIPGSRFTMITVDGGSWDDRVYLGHRPMKNVEFYSIGGLFAKEA